MNTDPKHCPEGSEVLFAEIQIIQMHSIRCACTVDILVLGTYYSYAHCTAYGVHVDILVLGTYYSYAQHTVCL